MALVSTVSGASSNSYAEQSEANSFFNDSLDADKWSAVSNKDPALITATSFLELMLYCGDKTSPAQSLNHPRSGLYDQYDVLIPSGTIAPQIKEALYHLALYMAENPDAFGVKDYTKKIKVDVIVIEKDIAAFGKYDSLPERVKSLIDPFLEEGGSEVTLNLI